jgi:hypothetical protein
MLITAVALVSTLMVAQKVDKPTLELYQERFVVHDDSGIFRVPILDHELPPTSMMYRRNESYAVWDERGLTIRNGKWNLITKLADLPVNAKLQSRMDIRKTLELVRTGDRKLDAAGISGSRRVGAKAYFLARWNDKSGATWLEALVSVDLTSSKAKPQLEGEFAGLSIEKNPIANGLMVRGGKLAIPVNAEGGWGMATFDTANSSFDFDPIGDKLSTWRLLPSGEAIYTEETSYGTSIAARLSADDIRDLIVEGRGAMSFIDDQKPEIVRLELPGASMLYWASSGAELRIDRSAAVKRIGKYVLTWSPAQNPREARLYLADRWKQVAAWKAP